jgi:hypothetical protein
MSSVDIQSLGGPIDNKSRMAEILEEDKSSLTVKNRMREIYQNFVRSQNEAPNNIDHPPENLNEIKYRFDSQFNLLMGFLKRLLSSNIVIPNDLLHEIYKSYAQTAVIYQTYVQPLLPVNEIFRREIYEKLDQLANLLTKIINKIHEGELSLSDEFLKRNIREKAVQGVNVEQVYNNMLYNSLMNITHSFESMRRDALTRILRQVSFRSSEMPSYDPIPGNPQQFHPIEPDNPGEQLPNVDHLPIPIQQQQHQQQQRHPDVERYEQDDPVQSGLREIRRQLDEFGYRRGPVSEYLDNADVGSISTRHADITLPSPESRSMFTDRIGPHSRLFTPLSTPALKPVGIPLGYMMAPQQQQQQQVAQTVFGPVRVSVPPHSDDSVSDVARSLQSFTSKPREESSSVVKPKSVDTKGRVVDDDGVARTPAPRSLRRPKHDTSASASASASKDIRGSPATEASEHAFVPKYDKRTIDKAIKLVDEVEDALKNYIDNPGSSREDFLRIIDRRMRFITNRPGLVEMNDSLYHKFQKLKQDYQRTFGSSR